MVHFRYIKPKCVGDSSKYENLKLVQETVHRLIHAAHKETIIQIPRSLKLNEKQIQKVNEPRKSAGLCSIHRATKSENYISNFLLVDRIDKTTNHTDGARSAVKVARSVGTGGNA